MLYPFRPIGSATTGLAMSDTTHPAQLEVAVHLALSRLIGTQSGHRTMVRPLSEIVLAIEGAPRGWRNGRTVMQQLEMSPAELDNRWVVARANGNLLPRRLVEAFFPADEWQHFAAFVAMGPGAATAKIESILSCWARGFNTDGSPRRRALAAGTVQMYITAFYRFMRDLCEVRKLAAVGQVDLDPAVLAGWELDQLPKNLTAQQLGARAADSDRRAPSLRSVRLALRALDRDIQNRRKTKHGRRYMSRLMRNRALLATFVTLGPRLGATAALRQSEATPRARVLRLGRHNSTDVALMVEAVDLSAKASGPREAVLAHLRGDRGPADRAVGGIQSLDRRGS